MILTVGSCLLEGEPELKHSSLNEPGEHVPSTQFRPVICRMRCQSTRKQPVKFAISVFCVQEPLFSRFMFPRIYVQCLIFVYTVVVYHTYSTFNPVVVRIFEMKVLYYVHLIDERVGKSRQNLGWSSCQ